MIFTDYKKIHKFFFFIDVICNLFTLFLNRQLFRETKTFFVYSVVNIVPIIFGIILKKKIVWYILEKPNYIFSLSAKFLSKYSNIKFLFISGSIAKFLKIKNYDIYFTTINTTFWIYRIKYKNEKNLKDICITCIGNLNKTKNHYQLLQFLEKTNIKYKFNIVGKKLKNQLNYYKRLKLLANKINFKNPGSISIHENKKEKFIKNILKKTDIYILPSKSEGLSISLTEAMSMSKLCLVSESSNHSKIIKNNFNGFEFKLNYISFKNNLAKIINLGHIKRKKIMKNSRNTILKHIKKNKVLENKLKISLFKT